MAHRLPTLVGSGLTQQSITYGVTETTKTAPVGLHAGLAAPCGSGIVAFESLSPVRTALPMPNRIYGSAGAASWHTTSAPPHRSLLYPCGLFVCSVRAVRCFSLSSFDQCALAYDEPDRRTIWFLLNGVADP